MIDTDVRSPGVHFLLGLTEPTVQVTLIDYLWGRCSAAETAYDVSSRLGVDTGKCWLIPSSPTTDAITRLIERGYDISRLGEHLDQVIDELNLDVLLIDTHPGLSKETVLCTSICDRLILLLRPDQQDYFGTAVELEVARNLEVPRIELVVNKVLAGVDQRDLSQKLEEAFGSPVIGIARLCEEMVSLGSGGLFVREYPGHEVSDVFRSIAAKISDP